MLRALNSFKRGYSISSSRLLSTLAVAENTSAGINAGTFNAIAAAQKLGGPVSVLVSGSQAKTAAETLSKIPGLDKVLVCENSAYDRGLPENLSVLLAENIKKNGFTHVLAASTAFGKNVLPRVGALLDVQPISDVVKVESEDTFVRPIYAGNALQTVKSNDPVKLLTVRTSAFDAVEPKDGAAAVEEAVDPNAEALSNWVSEDLTVSERPDLGTAKKVVSGGRGLKDKENFDKVIFPFADALGAAVGASRAAVDSGFADNSLQVGQTGKVVAPDLYVAVGISGAIQHLAGMKDSKTIVAINKDAEAPIFQVADLGLVADLFEAVPDLTKKLSN